MNNTFTMRCLHLLLLLISINHIASAQTIVNTQFGPIQGAQNGGVVQFLGIPFAKPPVDSLRWRAPQNPDAWATTLNTTAFKPACAQKTFSQIDTSGKVHGSEDCLFLNVWTPQTGNGTRPVMVFIHGGGNQQGGANDTLSNTAIYWGRNVAERSDVVVVTIQYRLGALGYLVHEGLEAESANGKSGNYGVLDHILALKWVKNNVHLFGGDTSNVTIFGESAGGVNVGNLLITDEAKGLFHRAIIQSAVPNLAPYNDAKTKCTDFVNSFPNATGTDVQKIAYLRSLPADSITVKYTSPLSAGLLQQNFQPAMDGILFTKLPTQAFESGNYNKVPVIIGSNSDEMSLNAPQVVTPAMVTLLVNSRVPLAYRSQVLALYPAGNTNAQARKAYIDILSDAQFNAPVRRTARCLSANQTEPVWNYWFSHAHTLPQLAAYGAYHGIELLYVFNTLENSQIGIGPLFKPSDDSVQKNMRKYWTNFARTGNPNGSDLVSWVEFENGNDCYLEIKATPINTQCKLLQQKFDLWDEIANFNSCNTSVSIHELKERKFVSAYPNPTSGELYLDIDMNTSFSIEVYDVFGRKVLQDKNNSNIDLNPFASGVYFIHVVQSQKRESISIVKE